MLLAGLVLGRLLGLPIPLPWPMLGDGDGSSVTLVALAAMWLLFALAMSAGVAG